MTQGASRWGVRFIIYLPFFSFLFCLFLVHRYPSQKKFLFFSLSPFATRPWFGAISIVSMSGLADPEDPPLRSTPRVHLSSHLFFLASPPALFLRPLNCPLTITDHYEPLLTTTNHHYYVLGGRAHVLWWMTTALCPAKTTDPECPFPVAQPPLGSHSTYSAHSVTNAQLFVSTQKKCPTCNSHPIEGR